MFQYNMRHMGAKSERAQFECDENWTDIDMRWSGTTDKQFDVSSTDKNPGRAAEANGFNFQIDWHNFYATWLSKDISLRTQNMHQTCCKSKPIIFSGH